MLSEMTSEQFAEWIAFAGLHDGIPVEEVRQRQRAPKVATTPSEMLAFMQERFPEQR